MTNKQYADLMSFLREMKEEQVLAQQALEERLLERINRLEINMESRLLSFEETAMLNSIHTSAAPVAPMLVGGPFAYKKPETKDSPVTAVQDLLRRAFSSLSDSQINDKYEAMGKKCLNACKGYAATGDHMGKPWRDISPMDKLIICRAATDNLKDSEGDWSFLDNCEGLWPIEYMVQPRWTNMSKKQRAKR